MLQNYAGLEPYTEDIETDGIAISSDDTLLANIRPYLKKVWKSEFNGACSTDVLAFSPEQINSDFLYSLIAQDKFIDYVMSGAKGSKMPRGDKSHIMDYTTSIPTEDEQYKISSFIELINKRIAAQTCYIEHLKKYKRGFIEKFFNETTLHQYDGYQVVSLVEIANLRGRIGFRGYTRSDIVSKGQGAVSFSPSNIMNGFVNFEECTYISEAKYMESPEIMVNQHDILFTKTGSTIGKIGYVKDLKERATINPQIALITAHSCDPYYLFLAMSRKAASNYVRSISVGGAIPTLSQEQLKQLSIPLITIEKQRELSSFILKLDNRIDCQTCTLTQLNKLKSGLMQQLFV